MIRVRRGTDPDLIVRLPNGIHTAIAMSWTDYARALDGPSRVGPAHLLEVNGLRQVAQLIAQIRHADRASTVEQS